VQTRQWQAREGTPIEVPEPRIVSFMGAADIASSIVTGDDGVGIGAQHHRGVTSQHANEVFKSGGPLGQFSGRLRSFQFGRVGCGRFGSLARSLALGLPLFFLTGFLAQLSLRGERPAVNDSELFLLVIRHGDNPSTLV